MKKWSHTAAALLLCAVLLLPAGALAAEEPRAAALTHHTEAGFTRELITDGFADPTKWDSSNAANASVAEGKATIKNVGPNNRLG